MNIKISNRLLESITSYCEDNKLNVDDYIVKCVEERHLIDKYGDMNEMKGLSVDNVNVTTKQQPIKKKRVVKKTLKEVTKIESDKIDVVPKKPVKRTRVIKAK